MFMVIMSVKSRYFDDFCIEEFRTQAEAEAFARQMLAERPEIIGTSVIESNRLFTNSGMPFLA